MTAVLFMLDIVGFGALVGATLAVWAWDLWLDHLDRQRLESFERDRLDQLHGLEAEWLLPTREPTM